MVNRKLNSALIGQELNFDEAASFGITSVNRTMDYLKIANAIERLERNLPLRYNQLRLAEELRQFHQAPHCSGLAKARIF